MGSITGDDGIRMSARLQAAAAAVEAAEAAAAENTRLREAIAQAEAELARQEAARQEEARLAEIDREIHEALDALDFLPKAEDIDPAALAESNPFGLPDLNVDHRPVWMDFDFDENGFPIDPWTGESFNPYTNKMMEVDAELNDDPMRLFWML